jgi:hypothetical protein
MNVERRFLFRGNAAVIGGTISRPRRLVIDAAGASSLTVVGGRSHGELKRRTPFGEFVRVGPATTSATGLFTDRKQVRERTVGRVREDSLTATTTVNVDVEGLVVGDSPVLRIDRLSATLTGTSSAADPEPSIRLSDLRISGIDIGGHTLVVELEKDLFARYDTRERLLAAAGGRSFAAKYGGNFMVPGGSAERRGRRSLLKPEDMMDGNVVRRIRWRGDPYPRATINRNSVVVPGFGRIYFGEIFITALSRRLTLVRLQLGSPIDGSVAAGEMETNGSWYP